MKIISIDVGIKNLAFCLFENTETELDFKIKLWNSINVSEKIVSVCKYVEKNNLGFRLKTSSYF